MEDISNVNNCPDGSPENVLMHYTVKFRMFEAGYISWHIPLDLGRGGMVLVDGAIITYTTEDVW
jgi:hypothetical protein